MDRFCVVVLCLLLAQTKWASRSECPKWPSPNSDVYTWGINDGTCYVVSRESTKCWHEAKDICERNGWRLLHIKTPEKHKFYSSMLRSISETCFWMGLSDIEKEGEWKWTDDVSSTTTTVPRMAVGDRKEVFTSQTRHLRKRAVVRVQRTADGGGSRLLSKP